jgi:MYXO-CTERM domain-containing protein
MKIGFIAIVGTASLVASADAGFLGFVAYAKQSGANVMVDIFCGVQNSSDKFLNVYNLNGTTTAAGGFYQQAGLATKTWKPDAASFNSTKSSVDSFMTAGCYSGGAYGGEYYASTNTNGDPNFTGTSWNATPASAAATTIPALAGWYTGDPTSVDNKAIDLAAANAGYTRFNSSATAASGSTGATVGSAGATYGIWCSHIVIAGTLNAQTLFNGVIAWNGAASIKDGVSGATSQGQSAFAAAPAPGAIALIGLAGFASRRRRA